MFDFIGLIASQLPLNIENSVWDGDTLLISAHDWSFKTDSAWRVSEGSRLLFACWDEDVDENVEKLSGLTVVNVSWLNKNQPIDLSICLSDGKRLDVFCTSSSDPWVFSLPDGKIYIGNT